MFLDYLFFFSFFIIFFIIHLLFLFRSVGLSPLKPKLLLRSKYLPFLSLSLPFPFPFLPFPSPFPLLSLSFPSPFPLFFLFFLQVKGVRYELELTNERDLNRQVVKVFFLFSPPLPLSPSPLSFSFYFVFLYFVFLYFVFFPPF